MILYTQNLSTLNRLLQDKKFTGRDDTWLFLHLLPQTYWCFEKSYDPSFKILEVQSRGPDYSQPTPTLRLKVTDDTITKFSKKFNLQNNELRGSQNRHLVFRVYMNPPIKGEPFSILFQLHFNDCPLPRNFTDDFPFRGKLLKDSEI